jgi:hypothetical protein
MTVAGPPGAGRYDIFMTNWTERTWMGPATGNELKRVMKTFIDYYPRKLRSEGYTGGN